MEEHDLFSSTNLIVMSDFGLRTVFEEHQFFVDECLAVSAQRRDGRRRCQMRRVAGRLARSASGQLARLHVRYVLLISTQPPQCNAITRRGEKR